MYHHGSGVIVYDPFRAQMKDRTKWWCVMNVDPEITRYYRWWLLKEKHLILYKPAWDAHVSIIRGEYACANKPELWNKYRNKKIDFLYQHGQIDIENDKDQSGQFFWIDVKCPMFNEIRNEFNLPHGWKYHLTIGRTYY